MPIENPTLDTSNKTEEKIYKGNESELIVFNDTMYKITSERENKEIGTEHPFHLVKVIQKKAGSDIKINKICSSMQSFIEDLSRLKQDLEKAKEENVDETDEKIAEQVMNKINTENNSATTMLALDLLSEVFRENKDSFNIEQVYPALDNASNMANIIKEKFKEKLS